MYVGATGGLRSSGHGTAVPLHGKTSTNVAHGTRLSVTGSLVGSD